MIKLKTLQISGIEPALHGMRNPKNSWGKSDSLFGCGYGGDSVIIGENDKRLAMQLAGAGSVHGKFRRMITVWVDITAPLYWWKEFDTYKVGTVANSCSTMHKIHSRELTLDDFSHEHLKKESIQILESLITHINWARRVFVKGARGVPGDDWEIAPGDKSFWWQMIQLLPTSYNQMRTVQLNYEVLANIYQYRRGHKLDEWTDFIQWSLSLPYPELFTGEKKS